MCFNIKLYDKELNDDSRKRVSFYWFFRNFANIITVVHFWWDELIYITQLYSQKSIVLFYIKNFQTLTSTLLLSSYQSRKAISFNGYYSSVKLLFFKNKFIHMIFNNKLCYSQFFSYFIFILMIHFWKPTRNGEKKVFFFYWRHFHTGFIWKEVIKNEGEEEIIN